MYVWKKLEKMKKKIIYFSLAISTLITGCDVISDVTGVAVPSSTATGQNNAPRLTNQEVIAGLKEALTVGITNAVDVTSVTDGFLGNNEIKLPFPESAIAIRDQALEWGLETQVNRIVETLNRAAEDAAKEATPIFVNAIKNMTINDGFEILNGGEGAATNFLRRTTTDQLITAFSPKVQESIEKVQLTNHWNPVATRYNQAAPLMGKERVEADLNDYVTRRAIDGLFTMVEKEENKIRVDPAARVTDILSKVFGSISN